MQEIKPKQNNPDHTPYIQINSKWIIALNVKSTTSEFLEKNIENVCDFELGKDFLYLIPKMKIDPLSLTNIKNSWSLKDTAMKWATDWRTIFPVTHLTIYKYLSKLNSKKTLMKMGKIFEKTLDQKRYLDGK